MIRISIGLLIFVFLSKAYGVVCKWDKKVIHMMVNLDSFKSKGYQSWLVMRDLVNAAEIWNKYAKADIKIAITGTTKRKDDGKGKGDGYNVIILRDIKKEIRGALASVDFYHKGKVGKYSKCKDTDLVFAEHVDWLFGYDRYTDYFKKGVRIGRGHFLQ
jgi:hypothetical protein